MWIDWHRDERTINLEMFKLLEMRGSYWNSFPSLAGITVIFLEAQSVKLLLPFALTCRAAVNVSPAEQIYAACWCGAKIPLVFAPWRTGCHAMPRTAACVPFQQQLLLCLWFICASIKLQHFRFFPRSLWRTAAISESESIANIKPSANGLLF